MHSPNAEFIKLLPHKIDAAEYWSQDLVDLRNAWLANRGDMQVCNVRHIR
ncbi:hypothetical protein GALL_436000 [mine drainage metagenome]|uniref:Uncharacterized protein n=1 Tax=mine drainage metagenome TaxID=410659 RepID=A0A1J5PT03_9ZZZZ